MTWNKGAIWARVLVVGLVVIRALIWQGMVA